MWRLSGGTGRLNRGCVEDAWRKWGACLEGYGAYLQGVGRFSGGLGRLLRGCWDAIWRVERLPRGCGEALWRV